VLATALQQRTLTAALLAPLAVAAVLFLPTGGLALGLAAVVALAAWEWAALAGVEGQAGRLIYLIFLSSGLVALWLQPAVLLYLLVAAAIWWCATAIWLPWVRVIGAARGRDGVLLALGLLVLSAPWAALIQLHGLSGGPAEGPILVLALLVLIWVADTAAYFVGRRWGRAKLAPALSPGKTWAGLLGGLLGAAAAGAAMAAVLGLHLLPAVLLVALCGVTALVSIVGDLFESLLKRRRAVKDSGRLLPGHGGILDRIDSLTAAAPVFALGLIWLGGRL
jgi:phosphatidate cytidylyltransferase